MCCLSVASNCDAVRLFTEADVGKRGSLHVSDWEEVQIKLRLSLNLTFQNLVLSLMVLDFSLLA